MLTSTPLLCLGLWNGRSGHESTADTPDYPGLERRETWATRRCSHTRRATEIIRLDFAWSEFQSLRYNSIGISKPRSHTPLSDIFISYSRSTAPSRKPWRMRCSGGIPSGGTPRSRPARLLMKLSNRRSKRQSARRFMVERVGQVQMGQREAAEGNRRGILLPALIEDDAKIPLEFRYTQASRLTDGEGKQSIRSLAH